MFRLLRKVTLPETWQLQTMLLLGNLLAQSLEGLFCVLPVVGRTSTPVSSEGLCGVSIDDGAISAFEEVVWS